ncbi:FixH family protein [Poriferisphaera sp. WC338]|uniref:FixH family protein n=1 Tax=Poriferisphaera sp. WC338 TaxID=3425129 RepID=UPI003D812EFC
MTDNAVNNEDRATLLRKSKFMWAGVVALLVIQVILGIFAIYLIVGDKTNAITPNYYKKAIHWDEHAALLTESKKLGWTINPSFSHPDVTGQRTMSLQIQDKDGNPIRNADINATYFAHTRAADEFTASLDHQTYSNDSNSKVTGKAGVYFIPIRIQRKGTWSFRFTVTAPIPTGPAAEDVDPNQPLGRFYTEMQFKTNDWRGGELSKF